MVLTSLWRTTYHWRITVTCDYLENNGIASLYCSIQLAGLEQSAAQINSIFRHVV